MKLSINWIREYTKITFTPEELKERLSVSLTEVEEMEQFGDRFKGIIVAEVLSVSHHPVSDTLLVLELHIGDRKIKTVVQRCDVSVGDRVAYLPVGSIIPGSIVQNGKKNIVTEVQQTGSNSVASYTLFSDRRRHS